MTYETQTLFIVVFILGILAGLCIGYFIAFMKYAPKIRTDDDKPTFDIQSEIDKTRRRRDELRRAKQKYSDADRELRMLTAWSLK